MKDYVKLDPVCRACFVEDDIRDEANELSYPSVPLYGPDES